MYITYTRFVHDRKRQKAIEIRSALEQKGKSIVSHIVVKQ